ncbi:apoptosis-stimulating of p53 protein 2-like isoform X2 [Mya arenaria]|uniref:apoptosis-stimulating of p53 protein 2-like isoform X2 n=2 Tax=Mya arenaria TaxID=6604 RepID=UPI0022E2A73F|nr:apoptosis-stimulating of p53 protein 2-like isoform X2 [Mya arenaria]
MAETFTFDSAEEDWDLNTLYYLNSQLESYIKMLPGGGVDMTLSELQEMAARQQQQIESQQQILVAKEQRLKYLKQQEQKQQQLASENDRLRRLRDKVEAQESKLRKLRALRGQVEQHKASNGNLNYELESIKALFNEKEKELTVAVAKVEEMTRQLEEIRSGRVKSATNTQSPAALAELEKLKKELVFKNKQNEQQNTKLSGNRELLAKRKDELARMDNRIHELQTRLKKKRALNTDMEKNRNQANAKPVQQGLNNQLLNNQRSNVAAVEPYVQEPQVINNNAGFAKHDPKYQSLPPSSKYMYPDKGLKVKETNNNNTANCTAKSDLDKSDEYSIPLVVSVDNSNKPILNGQPSPKQSPVNAPSTGPNLPAYPGPPSGHMAPSSSSSGAPNRLAPGMPTRSGMSHFAPKPYGSTYSSSVMPNRTMGGVNNDHPPFDVTEEIRQSGSGQSSPGSVESLSSGSAPHTAKSLPPYPQRDTSSISKPQLKDKSKPSSEVSQNARPPSKDNKINRAAPPPVPNRPPNAPTSGVSQQGNNTRLPQNQNNSANNSSESSDSEQTTMSVSKGIEKFTGLIAKNHNDGSTPHVGFSNLNHASALGAVRSAPTYRYASKRDIASTYLGTFDNAALEKYQKKVQNLHRDLSATYANSKSEASQEIQGFSQTDKLKEEEKDSLSPLSNHTSPLSSASTPSPATPPSYPFDFPTSPPHADIASDKVSFKPHTPKNVRRRHSDSDNEEIGKALHKYGINTNASKQLPVQENQLRELDNKKGVVEIQATTFSDNIPETVLLDNKGNIVEVVDTNKESVQAPREDAADKVENVKIEVKSNEPKLKKKSNLKPSGSKKHKNRVSFDPLALLLDASLEGELDLVRRCAHQVDNVSASNDEGITALHNAICAGHYEIVTFLVEFGCDVNSPDSDGWTPLHCAASCNNLPMVKFLVEHGACIFATTISDRETAAEKCEEDEEGFSDCSEYLYSTQEKLGIINNGAVYAVFDYVKENADEITMEIGDKLTVLKKGDEHEKDWWWTRKNSTEEYGYIPKNLLGMTPRVIPLEQPEGQV